MKKIIISIILIICLTGCDYIPSEDEEAYLYALSFCEALTNKDESLKSQFSTNVINNNEYFDNDLNDLFDYVSGDFEMLSKKSLSVSTSVHFGSKTIDYSFSCYLTTTEGCYDIYFKVRARDDKDKLNIGITRIAIINLEDYIEDTPYTFAFDKTGIIISYDIVSRCNV